jgi:hypothetical protein
MAAILLWVNERRSIDWSTLCNGRKLRGEDLRSLLSKVQAWLATLDCLELLKAQVS